MSENRACDLCSLDVGVKPFVLNTPEKQYQFCCEGCRGIYEMLHDIKEAPVQNEQNQPNKS
ncbi:heavy metal translocating P-type ATPase metal-binding domain-containing protein [Ferribacterium limneticum]|uniref:heavy metal translocating P-type ATPase metal-binding domain-containing protein n=1 Tax=Ferribacterium limneticum TaxID=76259 RepID=UPI001CF9293B|nr:heavy metal translocating P-type ATPase metal-binding domain-containing protein [Ferribacterium limneticum]UCV26876.1 hypothetical protein KI617_11235 [Ferribacterium limneticum]UCV30793.1 hypothetical protein KI608_11235 [Ferribacterium limneticum]